MRQVIHGWTALRAAAALWVALFHFSPHFGGAIDLRLISKGYLAVDLFFILSGAVMFHVYSSSLISSGTGNKFSWRSYMGRRFARLYPVHFVTMIFAVIILYGGPALGFGGYPKYSLPFAILINGFALQSLGFMGLSLNYPSWSISAEFCAYIAFLPLALLTLKAPRAMSWALGILAFIFCFVALEIIGPKGLVPEDQTSVLTQLTYKMSFLRILPEFFMGMMIMRSLEGCGPIRRGWAMVAVPATIAAMFFSLFAHSDIVFVVMAAGLIGLLSVVEVRVATPILILGYSSYSFYMVHGLVEVVVFKLLERIGHWPDNDVPLWTLPIPISIAIAAGYVTWKWVEEPARKKLARILS
jgi:peptidoglycan/LPS O-acetylase OafA/YrhL